MGIYPEYDGPVEISHPAEGVTFVRRAEPPAPTPEADGQDDAAELAAAKRRERQRRIARITGPLHPDPDADLARPERAECGADPCCGRHRPAGGPGCIFGPEGANR